MEFGPRGHASAKRKDETEVSAAKRSKVCTGAFARLHPCGIPLKEESDGEAETVQDTEDIDTWAELYFFGAHQDHQVHFVQVRFVIKRIHSAYSLVENRHRYDLGPASFVRFKVCNFLAKTKAWFSCQNQSAKSL